MNEWMGAEKLEHCYVKKSKIHILKDEKGNYHFFVCKRTYPDKSEQVQIVGTDFWFDSFDEARKYLLDLIDKYGVEEVR